MNWDKLEDIESQIDDLEGELAELRGTERTSADTDHIDNLLSQISELEHLAEAMETIEIADDEFPGCCGYQVVYGFPVNGDSDVDHWAALCALLDITGWNKRVLVTLNTTSQAKMADLLEATPYAKVVDEFTANYPTQRVRTYVVSLTDKE